MTLKTSQLDKVSTTSYITLYESHKYLPLLSFSNISIFIREFLFVDIKKSNFFLSSLFFSSLFLSLIYSLLFPLRLLLFLKDSHNKNGHGNNNNHHFWTLIDYNKLFDKWLLSIFSLGNFCNINIEVKYILWNSNLKKSVIMKICSQRINN